MGVIQEIFVEYTRMRENGLDANATLRTLRPYIEPLANQEREELARQLRAWEAGIMEEHMTDKPATEGKKSAIKPLKPGSSSSIRKLVAQETDDALWATCPYCGKKNRSKEVFCYSCGHLLESVSGEHDTQLFADAGEKVYSADYFGPDSVLFLEMRDLQQAFELRPQRRDHELVIGRGTENSVMAPDIDLGPYRGAEQGVSRLHMGMKYEPADKTIQVYDLGSSNGSYINGQKLHPKELRVLRNSDELRLGKFILRVYFRHPGEEIRG